MRKKSKMSKKSKMKHGFENKNQRNRLKKKKFKKSKIKSKRKRKRKKRLTGGARFESEPSFKSALTDKSIAVSEEPTVVSYNILDIVYNGLGLPSVIYDLFMILYVFKVDHSFVDFDIDKILNFNAYSTPGHGCFPPTISHWGIYDQDYICKLLNEKFVPIQQQIQAFINEYISKNNINISDLESLNHLLDLLETDLLSGDMQAEIQDKMPEKQVQIDFLREGIKIVKQMEIVKLEYNYTIVQRKMILYRALGNCRDDRFASASFASASLSFGLSLFAGFFNDPDASTICYLIEKPILSVYIFNPQEEANLFYLPHLIPIVSLLASGELFHGRSKIPIGLIKKGIQGFANQGYFPDERRFFKPLVTSLTLEQIEDKFKQIRGEDYVSKYTEVELEGKTGYKQVYLF
jgi:hypothetical protein